MTFAINDAGTPVLRQLSVRAVMDVLLRRGRISRADLAKITGFSKQTMSEVIRELEGRGLVRARGLTTGGVGRNAVTYEVDDSAGFVLGVDIGATTLRMAAASIVGTITAEVEAPLDRQDPARLIAQVEDLKATLMAKARLQTERLGGAVVATPGVIDPRSGKLSLAPNAPGLESINLLETLTERLGCAVAIENNINCAAIGETCQDEDGAAESLAFVSLGTGVGLGVLIDGRPLRGSHGAAGEISYLPFGSDPYLPSSLDRGALECAIGAAAISRRYQAAGGDVGTPTAEILARARAGERPAVATVTETARIAALLIVAVQAMFDPARIVLGGTVGRHPEIVDLIRAALPACTKRPIAIETSRLGRRATLVGAVAVALTRLHNSLFSPQDLPEQWRLPGILRSSGLRHG